MRNRFFFALVIFVFSLFMFFTVVRAQLVSVVLKPMSEVALNRVELATLTPVVLEVTNVNADANVSNDVPVLAS